MTYTRRQQQNASFRKINSGHYTSRPEWSPFNNLPDEVGAVVLTAEM